MLCAEQKRNHRMQELKGSLLAHNSRFHCEIKPSGRLFMQMKSNWASLTKCQPGLIKALFKLSS